MRLAGVDIGSSRVKACLFDLTKPEAPRLLESRALDCPLVRPRQDRAEHNLKAIEQAVATVLEICPPEVPVGFTSAMHSLVLLDSSAAPLGQAVSWADLRSAQQAKLLKKRCPELHRRSGTPVHPMGWPAKLFWFRHREPSLWSQVARVTDLKSYLQGRLSGRLVPLDLSNASGTGLYDTQDRCWDKGLLGELGLTLDQLPEVVSPRQPWEWDGRTGVLGGGDGPISNLGLGALGSDRLAVSLGTSGAVRQALQGRAPFDKRLFEYALDEDIWVQGGALSNGGSVLDWLARHHSGSKEEILHLAGSVQAGAEGLLVHPYFSGERAPFWNPDVRSLTVGWSFHHEFAHLARATLEGVAFCLKRLAEGWEAPLLRCAGGMFKSPFWCQLLADVTGKEVAVSAVPEATALGAALLTQRESFHLSRQLPVSTCYQPQEAAHNFYKEAYQDWNSWSPPLP